MERPTNPTETDVTRALIEQATDALHTSFPARVEAYDHEKQTVDVKPSIKFPFRQPDDTVTYEELPIITSVPVVFPRSAGWFVAFGLDVGDTVLVIVPELSIAHWRETDGESPYVPGDLRRHHLGDAVALPGVCVTSKALAHAPAKATGAASNAPAMVLGSDAADGTRVTINLDGSVAITRGATVAFAIDTDGTVHVGGEAGNAIADAMLTDQRLQTLQLAHDTHTHVVAGPAPAFVMVAGVAAPTVSPVGSLASVGTSKSKAT